MSLIKMKTNLKWPFTKDRSSKVKVREIWFKKSEPKTIKKCEMCPKTAFSNKAKYCLDCSIKKELEGDRRRSILKRGYTK